MPSLVTCLLDQVRVFRGALLLILRVSYSTTLVV